MLDPEVLAYYKRREAYERQRVAKAVHPGIARIHLELAQCYARIIRAATALDPADRLLQTRARSLAHPVPMADGNAPKLHDGPDFS